MVLSSKLDFNLTLETANLNFLENIFCAIETNVSCNQPNFFNTKCFLKCGKLMKYALWTILENNCNIEKDLESQRAESCHLKVRKSRCYNDEYCRSDPNTVQKM